MSASGASLFSNTSSAGNSTLVLKGGILLTRLAHYYDFVIRPQPAMRV